MDAKEEWSVPNSDDERDEASLSIKQYGCNELPVKILKYYEDIEKNKVLELNVKEFRKPFKQDNLDEDKDGGEDFQEEKKDNEESSSSARADEKEQHDHESQLEKSNEPSAFDYLEEPDDCQGQVTRRTPKTGRLPKKRVGTLKNVISNLKRYKELDSSTGEESKLTTEEEKSEIFEKDIDEPKDNAVDSENT